MNNWPQKVVRIGEDEIVVNRYKREPITLLLIDRSHFNTDGAAWCTEREQSRSLAELTPAKARRLAKVLLDFADGKA